MLYGKCTCCVHSLYCTFGAEAAIGAVGVTDVAGSWVGAGVSAGTATFTEFHVGRAEPLCGHKSHHTWLSFIHSYDPGLFIFKIKCVVSRDTL